MFSLLQEKKALKISDPSLKSQKHMCWKHYPNFIATIWKEKKAFDESKMFLLFQYCLCVTFSSIQSLAFNKLTNLVELDLGNNKLKVSSYLFFCYLPSYLSSYLLIFTPSIYIS